MRSHRWEDIMHAWRNQPSNGQFWTNFETCEASLSTWSRIVVRFTLGRSWEGHVWLGLKWKRSKLHLRRWCGFKFFKITWHRFDLSRPSGSLIRLLIFRKTTIGHHLQRSQLLRLIWELRCSNEHRLISNVFVSNFKIFKKEKMILYIRILILQ